MSQQLRTLENGIPTKAPIKIDVRTVSDDLEDFIDLMLIAAVKGRM